MKKSDLKLNELPAVYASDNKFSDARTDDNFSLEIYLWSDEEAKEKNFSIYHDPNETLCKASVENYSDLNWVKADAQEVQKLLNKIGDDDNCQFEFTIWADDCRDEIFLVKPVAINNEWIYFEPVERL